MAPSMKKGRRAGRIAKPKILLDEGLLPRQRLKKLNRVCTIRHVAHDLKRSGLADRGVYQLACQNNFIIVTYNGRHFKPLITAQGSSVVGVSPRLTDSQLDTKLKSLIRQLRPGDFHGHYLVVTGETR